MYAVIETGGKQHKVSEGEILKIDKVEAEPGTEVTFDKVIMVKPDDAEVKVGTPYVENASVTAEVVEQGKHKKIIVFKYKRKKNYQRKQGHRQRYTAIRITNIAA
ncbi:50S ribosomal protein L21 [candidate division KSB3 bacterium]|uniref:Large ribosomal subunit protein bL21 n=1 Tax=candidate division KSB3 bacterium TaxID=2044937 RepID=A0A9D5Q606_9BACT|nr:50S ribosomal protein L21 [candidate division KSB3 bacterium]MBD3324913.1 50S ribosomal protein L21 [candidate division KSB3 bacterium]